MQSNPNQQRTGRKSALTLLFLFALMGGLTFLNLLFSNTIPRFETCGLIHPLVFQAQVSFVNPDTSVNYNTGFQPIPMDSDSEALDTVLRLYDDSYSFGDDDLIRNNSESLLITNDDIDENVLSSAIYHFKNNSTERKTYYIEVGTFTDSQNGRYEFYVTEAQTPDLEEVLIGIPVEATLVNGEIDRFYVNGTEQKLQIDVRGTTTDGTELDSYLRVLDSSRNPILESDDARSLGSFLSDISVPEGDFIILEIEGLNDEISANYTLSVDYVEPDPLINIGDTLAGSLSLYERNAYSLRLDPTEIVNIRVASDFDSYLRLYDENGDQISSNDDSGGGVDASIFGFEISNTQTVTVEVGSYADSESGNYELTVEAGTPDADAIGVNPGDLIQATLQVGQRIPYLLDVSPDMYFNITINSDFDSYMRIYDSEGFEIAVNDDLNELDAGIVNFSHNATETLTIEVASYSDSHGGDFVLTIQEVEAVNHVSLNGELAYGERETYVIDLEANTPLNIYLESDFDTYLRLYNEDGNQIISNDDFDGLNAGITGFTVEDDTQLSIEVAGYGDTNSGSYTLIIESPGIDSEDVQFDSSTTVDIDEPVFEEADPVELVINEAVNIPRERDSFSDFDSLEANSRQPYIFTIENNQAFDIEIESNFDSYLRIYDEAGDEIFSDDDSAGNFNAGIYDFIPGRQSIIIEVASFSDASGGDYTLTINPAGSRRSSDEEVTDIIDIPDDTRNFADNNEIATGGEVKQYRVTLNAGEMLDVLLDSNFDSALAISDADGNELDFNDDFDELDAGIAGFTVSQDTVLTILVGSIFDTETGNFDISIRRYSSADDTENTPPVIVASDGKSPATQEIIIDNPNTNQAIRIDEVGDIRIIEPGAVSERLRREITRNKRDVFTLELRGGQAVDIILRTAPNDEPLLTRILRKFSQNPFADNWASCLEYYGYTDTGDGIFNIDIEGFSRFVVGGKDSGEGQCDFSGFADTNAEIFLKQFIDQCEPSATIALTALGRVMFFVILPGLAILLPIMTVAILEDDNKWWWITGLSFVAVYVLTSSLLYLHLGEVSAIVALQEFAYGLFGGTATGAAIAFIGKALDNFSTKSAQEERMLEMQHEYQQQMVQLLYSIRHDGVVMVDDETQQNPAFDDDDSDEPEE